MSDCRFDRHFTHVLCVLNSAVNKPWDVVLSGGAESEMIYLVRLYVLVIIFQLPGS